MSERQFNAELGRRLGAIRKARGMTQAEVARLVGLTRVSISNIECGRQSPPLYRIARMCWAMNYSLSLLVKTPWEEPTESLYVRVDP